ncbi:unnamed protein product [marine sediment metagenome]|uniref:Uncharacterized protein n=1 Tax=marine sediment metagenome TaxID=412755 RepID=X1KR76_9ZZZZ
MRNRIHFIYKSTNNLFPFGMISNFSGPGVILLFIGGVLEIAGVIVMKKITSIGK